MRSDPHKAVRAAKQFCVTKGISQMTKGQIKVKVGDRHVSRVRGMCQQPHPGPRAWCEPQGKGRRRAGDGAVCAELRGTEEVRWGKWGSWRDGMVGDEMAGGDGMGW